MILAHRFLGGSPRIYWREADYAKLARVYGVAEDAVAKLAHGHEPEFLPPVGVGKAIGDVRRAYTFTLSNGEVDRMNDTVAVAGIGLSDYRKNPVVLFNHNSRALPIGRSTRIGVADGKLKATVDLATEASDLAERVRALILHGSLKAASIGFIPKSWVFNHPRGGIDFHEVSLLEWSVVSTPALASALIDPGQTGKALSEHEWRAREQNRKRRLREVDVVRLGTR